jgi:hypothetical protein
MIRLAQMVVMTFGVLSIAVAECPVDNFDDGDAGGWIHCGNWGEDQIPLRNVESGQYCLGLDHPVRSPPPPPISIAAEWAESGQDESFANGCLRVSFHSGTEAEGTWNSHFVISMRANCKVAGYRAMFGPSLGRISLYRRLALLADEVNHPFSEGTAYRAELCAVGHEITLKYWAQGEDEPEPEEPQLQATDKLHTRGRLGVGVFLENDNRGPILKGCFDDVRFVPTGHCAGDVDCNGVVDSTDMRTVAARWGGYEPCHPRRLEDLDGDCSVGFSDTLAVLKAWGECKSQSSHGDFDSPVIPENT